MPILYFTDEETEAQGGALTCPGSQKGVPLHRWASCLYDEGNTHRAQIPACTSAACYLESAQPSVLMQVFIYYLQRLLASVVLRVINCSLNFHI